MSDRNGVDVASFQGKPASWQATAGGIGWAAVKLTELSPAGYVDPDAAADWAWLAQAGHGRIGYLFGHPNVSATATVAYFIAELSRLGLRDTDAVALDIEVANGKTPAQVAAWSREVLASLRTNLHRTPLVYTFRDFITEGNVDGCESYPLWISDPDHPAGHPAVPAPFKTWAIHQYATTGQIDRDVIAYPTVAAMRAALGKQTPKPRPAARKDRHMINFLEAGANPVPIPTGTQNLHFVTATSATAVIDFHGHPAPVKEALSWTHGSTYVAVPPKVHAATVTISGGKVGLVFED